MAALALSLGSNDVFSPRDVVHQSQLQTPYGSYRDVSLPSFKTGLDRPINKRTQADVEGDTQTTACRDAASLALDQRLHELINNLYFDVFPDEKAVEYTADSDQSNAAQCEQATITAIGDQEMKDGTASTRSTEILTSLISLEKKGYKVCWEDTEELKKQVRDILREINPQPVKTLAGVGMEEIRPAVADNRKYKSLPKRAQNHHKNTSSEPCAHKPSKPMTLSNYLYQNSEYAESTRDRSFARSKRQRLSRDSSYDSIPDFSSDLQDSIHNAFPDTWPIMIRNLDLDASEDDVKVSHD